MPTRRPPVTTILLLVLSLVGLLPAAQDPTTCLWYARPATIWNEALPVGNGHMGAMVFGGTAEERIQFNEDTLWTGKPHDYVRPGAREALPEIRRLLAAGQFTEAENLVRARFLSNPVRQKAYQPFGDLRLQFPGHENPTDYRRELDLGAAIARTSYRVGDVTFLREVFASYPDRVVVVRLTADRPGQVSVSLQMDSPHAQSQTRVAGPDRLVLSGQVQKGDLRFESQLQVFAPGGTVTSGTRSVKPTSVAGATPGAPPPASTEVASLTIAHADSVTLLLVAATSFNNYEDISADPAARCTAALARLEGRDFASLRDTHTADHRSLFDRVTLDLGRTPRADLPTNQRLEEVKNPAAGLAGDPAFAALHFNYGRYLLIASSRPGSQPANLQGVWNELLDPPWESKMTTNINFEMNYWLAELTNLSECHEPLFDLVDDLVVSGGRTARTQYGCGGWVLHHNTDLWRGTAPINNIDGVWPTGGAWLSHHLWERYLFTGDREFLARRAYPVMKAAAEFFVDFLVKDPATGWLVSTPSHSPEQGGLAVGPTMDHQLIRSLFSRTIEAATLLGVDPDFADRLAAVRAQLAPEQIGKHGQLQEWLTDIDVPDNRHRHLSPLWALYPGADITPADPRLFAAAKKLLTWRGDGDTGWSFAWRMPLWARVSDGDFAFRQMEGLLRRRTLPNLFALCGPFQVDANFGATAGVVEMLLQSHEMDEGNSKVQKPNHKAPEGNPKSQSPNSKARNPELDTFDPTLETRNSKPETLRVLRLLPALPKAWPNGSITGLCARGGFEIDLAWSGGALTRAVIRSKLGTPARIHYGERVVDLPATAGATFTFDAQLQPLP